MTPVFSHGELRLYLLSLLDEEPRHGYDIIQALSDRTGGTYTPSAGTIYPRLAKLEDEGLVVKHIDGRKTIYSITEAGRTELHSRSDDIDTIESGLADSVRLIADEVRGNVREAMRSLQADLAAAAQASRRTAQEPRSSSSDIPDPGGRTESRVQSQRADVAVTAFRTNVRVLLRTHIARGGRLPSATVDALQERLDNAVEELKESLDSLR